MKIITITTKGMFPTVWSTEIIYPIIKKDDRDDA